MVRGSVVSPCGCSSWRISRPCNPSQTHHRGRPCTPQPDHARRFPSSSQPPSGPARTIILRMVKYSWSGQQGNLWRNRPIRSAAWSSAHVGAERPERVVGLYGGHVGRADDAIVTDEVSEGWDRHRVRVVCAASTLETTEPAAAGTTSSSE